jgi:dTDP-4-amino-4,6-dideoxygalactose transaminase
MKGAMGKGTAPAVEGGLPVRSGAPVPFFRAALSEADIQAVSDTLRSGWLTLGPRTAEFEAACAARLRSPHAVATSSCTASLFLALKAFAAGPGDEVIVPSLTFAASVNTILHTGAAPVLADIETQSFGLDPAEVEALVGPRTRGIVAVDYAGQPCRIDVLREVARRHGLFLLEDAAHAFGASLHGEPVGNLADATAFSFYATKCITTGEGGLLTCADPDLAQRVRLLGYHGMHHDAWKRYTARGTWFYEVELAGYKCNMTDVQAALGLSQLQREPELRASRQEVARFYSQSLACEEALELPDVRPEVEPAWHLYVVRLRPELLRVDRDAFAHALREEGIVPSVHFIPYHKHPVGRALPLRRPLSRTDDFASRCLSLPLFPHMPVRDRQDVVEAVVKLLHHYVR